MYTYSCLKTTFRRAYVSFRIYNNFLVLRFVWHRYFFSVDTLLMVEVKKGNGYFWKILKIREEYFK